MSDGLVIATPDGGSVAAADVIADATPQETQTSETTPGAPSETAPEAPQATIPEAPERTPAPDGYVPKGALFEEREKRRKVENTFAPIAQALQANPDLVAELEARMRGGGRKAEPAAPAEDFTEAEIQDAARDFALYQPDGTVDVAAAKNALRRIDQRTRAAVEQALKPVNQRFQNDAVSVARHQMQSLAQSEGVDPGLADHVFMQLATADPSLVQHDSVRQIVAIVAEGLQRRAGGAPAPAVPPPVAEVKVAKQAGANFRAPVMTENGTGRGQGQTNEIPRFMANAMRKAGLKPTADSVARANEAFSSGGPMVFGREDE